MANHCVVWLLSVKCLERTAHTWTTFQNPLIFIQHLCHRFLQHFMLNQPWIVELNCKQNDNLHSRDRMSMFASNFFFWVLLAFWHKKHQKRIYSTSILSAQHPNAGQNIQHPINQNTVYWMVQRQKYFAPFFTNLCFNLIYSTYLFTLWQSPLFKVLLSQSFLRVLDWCQNTGRMFSTLLLETFSICFRSLLF